MRDSVNLRAPSITGMKEISQLIALTPYDQSSNPQTISVMNKNQETFNNHKMRIQELTTNQYLNG